MKKLAIAGTVIVAFALWYSLSTPRQDILMEPPPQEAVPVQVSKEAVPVQAGSAAETQASDVLLSYMPEASEAQIRAAQEYVYDLKGRRQFWGQIESNINGKLLALQNTNISDSARTELRRVHIMEMDSHLASKADMDARLDVENRKFLAKQGITDVNLINELHQLGTQDEQ